MAGIASKIGSHVFSLLQVSHSLLPLEGGAAAVESIAALSARRNLAAGITGVLLYTGPHFAQVIEGEETAVRRLAASIAQDGRHSSPVVLHEGWLPARRYSGWSQISLRNPTYVERLIKRAIAENGGVDRYALNTLTRLLWEFARRP